MIKLFEGQKVSLYQVQKDLGLGIYTLYRYAKGQRNVENMPTKMVFDLAYYFKIEVNTLYKKMLDYQKKNGGVK
nr:MAG TPA: Regulatory protein-modification, helix-turn-helix, transcriptional regulator, DNA [Caudoviricetes sp.]